MPPPQLARYADSVRYDAERGLALALDWRAYPAETALMAYADAEAVVGAIEAGAVRHAAAAYLAGYGLALAARECAARRADTGRRGAAPHQLRQYTPEPAARPGAGARRRRHAGRRGCRGGAGAPGAGQDQPRRPCGRALRKDRGRP